MSRLEFVNDPLSNDDANHVNDVYYESECYPEKHPQELNDIEVIMLTPDELDEINNNNYHVILKQTDEYISLKELIKYERVNVKLNKPKFIKGDAQEGHFSNIEFRSDL